MSRMSELALFCDENSGRHMTREEIVNEIGELGLKVIIANEVVTPVGDNEFLIATQECMEEE